MNPLDARPLILALAGPNGAGKSTFYHAHLAPTGLRLVNADVIAREMGLGDQAAMHITEALRDSLVRVRESFVLETVFSDPVGDKLAFLQGAVGAGYTVVLCFIGIDGPETSEQRVAMRVSQGGHDVPSDRLVSRFPRTMINLQGAVGAGYTVVLCFIGIDGPETSEQRVAMRVSQGGHDVPSDRLVSRFPRTMLNLQAAIAALPFVWVFDNQDLRRPFRKVGVFESGRSVFLAARLPAWLAGILNGLA